MSDEELGKKDDDHKPVKSVGQGRPSSWQPARVPPRRSLKRLGLVFVVAVLVYLFVRNIPVLGPDDRMRRPIYTSSQSGPPSRLYPPRHRDAMHPPDPAAQAQTQTVPVKTAGRTFNGPIKFNNLGSSLQAIANTRGGQANNRNVLFAAASLRSAATLLPMACQMAAGLKSYVHFALLGRSSIDMKQLWEINGIDKSCVIVFHGMIDPHRICHLAECDLADQLPDARPDYAGISLDARLEKAVFRGFRMYKPTATASIFERENTDIV